MLFTSMDEEYLSKIVLELQPRSRRCCRALFARRENEQWKREEFDLERLTRTFLHEYRNRSVQRGNDLRCDQFILRVHDVHRGRSSTPVNTEVEYLFRGRPLPSSPAAAVLRCPTLRTKEENSCFCCECEEKLKVGDLFVRTEQWNRPILCLTCYRSSFAHRCQQCQQDIEFQFEDDRCRDYLTVRYVEWDEHYWHCDCCVCSVCDKRLIGEEFHSDDGELFCVEHR